MRSERLLILICFFLLGAGRISAQHTITDKNFALKVKKNIAFVVRRPDMLSHLAERFHVDMKTLLALNRGMHKNDILYAGRLLVIPVWMSRKSGREDAYDFNLADYQLDPDSVDYYVREDFICMADIEADTVRKTVIDKEIRKMDRRINAITATLDSIEYYERQNLSMKEAMKIPIARSRRSGNFSVGLEQDSLVKQKIKMIEEKAKIGAVITDYEFLVDNAGYMASHTSREITDALKLQEANARKRNKDKKVK